MKRLIAATALAAIVTAGAMQLGGLLVDRVGPRIPIMAGCVTMFFGSAGLASLIATFIAIGFAISVQLRRFVN